MVGWAERSESHQLELGRFLVGLASLGPPYFLRFSEATRATVSMAIAATAAP